MTAKSMFDGDVASLPMWAQNQLRLMRENVLILMEENEALRRTREQEREEAPQQQMGGRRRPAVRPGDAGGNRPEVLGGAWLA